MKKILVTEDDSPSRELLSEMLTSWGYEVIQASNGIEALEQIAVGQPDLVLLDIQMPLLDGFGVIERVRSDERFQSLPVVALTAYAMREDRQRTARAGFDAHLSKPVEMPALQAMVAALFATQFPVDSQSRENGANAVAIPAILWGTCRRVCGTSPMRNPKAAPAKACCRSTRWTAATLCACSTW
jgi:two-component system, cell cycle response regulator DivK